MSLRLLWLPNGNNDSFVKSYDACTINNKNLDSTNPDYQAWLENNADVKNKEILYTANHNYDDGHSSGLKAGLLIGISASILTYIGVGLVIAISDKIRNRPYRQLQKNKK